MDVQAVSQENVPGLQVVCLALDGILNIPIYEEEQFVERMLMEVHMRGNFIDIMMDLIGSAGQHILPVCPVISVHCFPHSLPVTCLCTSECR